MATEYERRTSQDYIDRDPTRYDPSGWGMVLGIIALLLIIGMLFIGFSSTPPTNTTSQPTVERTTPAPTTQPAPPAATGTQ